MTIPEGVPIRCQRCGGTFGFLPQPGHARCPYCAFEQPVSPELLAGLERYAGDVRGELERADAAYERAASWEQWAGQSGKAVPRLKLMIPAMSGLTLLTAVAIPLSQELGVPPEQMRQIVTPLLVLPSLLMMVFILWQYSGGRGRARRAVAGSVQVACPQCGARGELVAGAPAQICAYCRSALVASEQVMERGVDAAGLAHRQARLEEFRQERLGTVGLSRYDMTRYMPYFIPGSFVLPAGGGAIAFTVAMLSGEEPYSPMIFLLWGLALVPVAIILTVFVRRRSRRTQYDSVLSDLARQFSLQAVADAAGLAEWLNRHWPEKYELACLGTGPYSVAARIDARGYPALLNADFTRTQQRKPRLHLLLAAHRPRAVVSDPRAMTSVHQALARCRELGFHVAHTEAGLLATAHDETVAAVRRHPQALHLVAPALGALAAAAHASGSVPA